jgi:hypothetical protein
MLLIFRRMEAETCFGRRWGTPTSWRFQVKRTCGWKPKLVSVAVEDANELALSGQENLWMEAETCFGRR